MLKIIAFIALSLASGILYRLGGIGKPYSTKSRDWGCPLCLITCLWLFKGWHWSYLLVLGLSWGALSSYWKGKAVDMKWWNWALHGAGCGIAGFPLLWAGISFYSILYRTLYCAQAMVAVSEISENVWYEEIIRGIVFCATVVFLI